MFNLIKKCELSINKLSRKIIYNFAEDKSKTTGENNEVKIDDKYRLKSAALYDKYLQSRQKPTLSLDDYQINYCWILQRMPIFFPYNKNQVSYYKNRYQMAKKTGYYIPVPKDLIIEKGDYLFEQYQKSNPENIPSHQTNLNNETTYYRQNARYWKYVDPNIRDQKSVQNCSSDNVFFIVQNQNGEWTFPQRPIAQKQTHEDFFQNFAGQLFAGQAYPNIYFGDKKPTFVNKKQIPNLQKGIGIKTFYFEGYSMSGITKYPTSLFKNYKWVPKPHLHKYFSEEYAQKVIKLVRFYY